jgi:hypothetical protein
MSVMARNLRPRTRRVPFAMGFSTNCDPLSSAAAVLRRAAVARSSFAAALRDRLRRSRPASLQAPRTRHSTGSGGCSRVRSTRSRSARRGLVLHTGDSCRRGPACAQVPPLRRSVLIDARPARWPRPTHCGYERTAARVANATMACDDRGAQPPRERRHRDGWTALAYGLARRRSSSALISAKWTIDAGSSRPTAPTASDDLASPSGEHRELATVRAAVREAACARASWVAAARQLQWRRRRVTVPLRSEPRPQCRSAALVSPTPTPRPADNLPYLSRVE